MVSIDIREAATEVKGYLGSTVSSYGYVLGPSRITPGEWVLKVISPFLRREMKYPSEIPESFAVFLVDDGESIKVHSEVYATDDYIAKAIKRSKLEVQVYEERVKTGDSSYRLLLRADRKVAMNVVPCGVYTSKKTLLTVSRIWDILKKEYEIPELGFVTNRQFSTIGELYKKMSSFTAFQRIHPDMRKATLAFIERLFLLPPEEFVDALNDKMSLNEFERDAMAEALRTWKNVIPESLSKMG